MFQDGHVQDDEPQGDGRALRMDGRESLESFKTVDGLNLMP